MNHIAPSYSGKTGDPSRPAGGRPMSLTGFGVGGWGLILAGPRLRERCTLIEVFFKAKAPRKRRKQRGKIFCGPAGFSFGWFWGNLISWA